MHGVLGGRGDNKESFRGVHLDGRKIFLPVGMKRVRVTNVAERHPKSAVCSASLLTRLQLFIITLK